MRRQPRPPDRRRSGRFPLDSELGFWILEGRSAGETGTGRVVNVSSGGVLLECEKPLDVGTRIKLSIPWPVRLNQKCKLQLVAEGKVVRRHNKGVAVEFGKWEFRTRGSPDRNNHTVLP